MSDTTSHVEVKMGSDRSFGLIIGAVFLIIALWPLLSGASPRLWALVIAAMFGGAALVAPAILAPLNRVWFRFGLLLNRIVSPIVMGIIFFLTVVPIGLIRRVFKPDPLDVAFDKEAESYWIVRTDETKPTDMKKQF